MVTAREYGDELLRRLLDHAVAAGGAVGAGLSLVDGSPRSVAAVGVAAELDPGQWKSGHGPLWDALRTGRQLLLPPAAGAGEDGGAVAALLPDAGPEVRGAVVTPGEWGGEEPLLLSVYLDRAPTVTDAALSDEYEGLLGGALAVVEYCAGEELRAEQMLRMVQYRRVIEQAKGLVMAATGLDAAAAFATLSRASQHFNLRLRTLAVAVVEHVGKAPAEGPEGPGDGEVVVPTEHERAVAAQVWRALSAMPAVPGDDA